MSALCVCALLAAPARAYIASNRWTTTATDGSTGAQGTPITLTWSLAPNSTIVPNDPPVGATTFNNLISYLDANWGSSPGGGNLTLRPWFFLFEQSFDRLSALSGVTYVYQAQDDGAAFSSIASGHLFGPHARGDVRIAGKTYGGSSNVLASNFFPDQADMMVNTDANQVSFHILLHEIGHTYGLDDFYDWDPLNGQGFIMKAGSATQITEFDKWMLRDFWRHLKNRYGR
jgi:hypothetical protein